jgi:hypothetical protein
MLAVIKCAGVTLAGAGLLLAASCSKPQAAPAEPAAPPAAAGSTAGPGSSASGGSATGSQTCPDVDTAAVRTATGLGISSVRVAGQACTFSLTPPTGGVLTIRVTPNGKFNYDLGHTSGATGLVDVPGVGDSAYYIPQPPSLGVLQGTRFTQLSLLLTDVASVPAEQARRKLLALVPALATS